LFVSGLSGWGADGKSEAIFYVTRRADGSLYFYGMLFAPVGFIHDTPSPTPTVTATPAALIGPYAVVNVSPSDVLNIRSGAGVSQPILGYYPPDATDVMRTDHRSADGRRGSKSPRRGLTGWVNSYYLTGYVPPALCADSRILPLISQARQAGAIQRQSAQSLVSPVHGVNMRQRACGSGSTTHPAAMHLSGT
jgi:hypothetical protein